MRGAYWRGGANLYDWDACVGIVGYEKRKKATECVEFHRETCIQNPLNLFGCSSAILFGKQMKKYRKQKKTNVVLHWLMECQCNLLLAKVITLVLLLSFSCTKLVRTIQAQMHNSLYTQNKLSKTIMAN